MSMPEDWIEDARIERARLERRPNPQTGFFDDGVEDLYADDEPEDEEYSDDE